MTNKKIHMVGIGGIGMSGLARYLHSQGYSITGSDAKRSDITKALEGLGIKIFEGHSESNLDTPASLVIRSAAIGSDNPEIKKAIQNNIKVTKYAEILGKIMNDKTGIAIAGTHGKTTVTAMISYILSKAGAEPSFICGGIIPQLKGNSSCGNGKYFVAEACEYDRSFLNLKPKAVVIANIEEEHLDYYKNIDDIISAFKEFASSTGNDGIVIGNHDNEHTRELITNAFKEKGETYSITGESHWQAKGIDIKDGKWEFDVLKYGKTYGHFSLEVPGIHNVSNALAAIAVANWANVGREIIQVSLAEFKGVERRLQVLGERNGVLIIDDYAHHPTEVQTSLRAVKELFSGRKIWCIFQPHQYTRTRLFLKEFARSFGDTHLVILPDIYSARDDATEPKKVSSKDLSKHIDVEGKAALYLPTFDEIVTFIKSKAEPGTVLVTMGAGNVNEIAKKLMAG